MKKDIPHLDAYDIGDGVHWCVWCVHCHRWHFHGIGPGHVWAHCSTDSPYYSTGYVLVAAGSASEHVMKDIDRQRPRGPEPEKKT